MDWFVQSARQLAVISIAQYLYSLVQVVRWYALYSLQWKYVFIFYEVNVPNIRLTNEMTIMIYDGVSQVYVNPPWEMMDSS